VSSSGVLARALFLDRLVDVRYAAAMLFMIIEHYRNGDAAPVYERFRAHGRLAPEGLRYVSSWVTPDLKRCFQVMECDDEGLLRTWISHWEDLVEFEVIPVMTSAEAAAKAAV
jgi:hypothetical protein